MTALGPAFRGRALPTYLNALTRKLLGPQANFGSASHSWRLARVLATSRPLLRRYHQRTAPTRAHPIPVTPSKYRVISLILIKCHAVGTTRPRCSGPKHMATRRPSIIPYHNTSRPCPSCDHRRRLHQQALSRSRRTMATPTRLNKGRRTAALWASTATL
jgi:hypothetical protein